MAAVLIEHDGLRPTVADSAYVAPTAVLCGDVTLGADVRILFGAVISADGGPVNLGAGTVVMENAVVRGREHYPTRTGEHVLIGPHAHVNGAELEHDVFVATGASIFPGARVGAGSEVRINAVVHVNSVLPPQSVVPIGWIAAGDPAQLFAPQAHEELWPVQMGLDFPGTVFGIAREELTMAKVSAHYAELFGRHRSDRLVEEP
jgi:carbonic anhydrase/acetyltransferase-like protein (isoleucine patch superfamily)